MKNDMENFEGVVERFKDIHSGNTEGLLESSKHYLQELNVDSAKWEFMSETEKQRTLSDITERIDELGINNPKDQDKALREAEISPEILGDFREKLFNTKISELGECNSGNEITKEQFINECPEGAQIIPMMDERLANDYEDGIMNNIKFFKLENGDYALIHDADGEPNTKAVFSESCIYAKSGAIKDGNHGLNEVLNTKHAALDTTYFVDGRSCYEHDSLGRLTKETTVYTGNFVEKSDRGANQAYIRESKDGVDGDNGSHSVQYGLGGPNEAINQTPMRGDINKGGEWRGEERRIEDAVNNGKVVYSEHTYTYEGASARPTSVTSQTKIGGNSSEIKEFDNRLTVKA